MSQTTHSVVSRDDKRNRESFSVVVFLTEHRLSPGEDSRLYQAFWSGDVGTNEFVFSGVEQ